MYTTHDVWEIAKVTPSELAQKELLSFGCGRVLPSNMSIADSVWDELWGTKDRLLSFITKPELICRADNPHRISRVIDLQEPARLIPAVCGGSSKAGYALLKNVFDKYYSPDNVGVVESAICLGTGLLDKHQVKSFLNVVLAASGEEFYPYKPVVAKQFTNLVLESTFAKYDVFSDMEIAEILRSRTVIGESASRATLSAERKWHSRLIDFRPGLIQVALADVNHSYLYPAAAVSRYLFEPEARLLLEKILRLGPVNKYYSSELALKILVLNPNVSHMTKAIAYEKLADFCDENFRKESLSEFTKAELMLGDVNSISWDKFGSFVPRSVVNFLSRFGSDNYPTFVYANPITPAAKNFTIDPEYIQDVLSPYLDNLGVEAWTLFLNLLPGWKLHVSELLVLVNSSLS